MNSIFWLRMSEFLKKDKISFGTVLLCYAISGFMAAVLMFIRLAIHESKIEKTPNKANCKTRVQTGIEMYISSFLDPFINKQLNEESKEVRKHLYKCNLIRKELADVNLRDENWRLKNIKLNMPKKYWSCAVHVIIEKMIGERIPSNSKDLDMDLIKKIQNAMGELYSCNQNSEKDLDFNFDSGKWNSISSHMIMGLILAITYYVVVIFAMKAFALSCFLAVIAIFLMFLFRKKISSIYLSLSELIFCSFYMLAFLILIELLQYFGIIPLLLVQ